MTSFLTIKNSELLKRLRSPGGTGKLRLATRADKTDDKYTEGFLLDETTHICYPIHKEVPRILPRSNSIMARAAKEISDYPEANGYKIPDFEATSTDNSHYETNGINESQDESFDRERVDLATSLIPKNNESLIDIGAGSGFFIDNFSLKRPNVFSVGLERSSAAIDKWKKTNNIIQGTADCLPFADDSFDCSVSMETLEHLPQDSHQNSINEMARITRKFILINVPYKERRLQMQCRFCDCIFNPNYHLRAYGDEMLRLLVPGFNMIDKILLPRRENIIKAAALPFRKRVFQTIETAICPQCGLKEASRDSTKNKASELEKKQLSGLKAKQYIKELANKLPRVSTSSEAIVLYEKKYEI